jgi:hypothetical protein
MLQFDTYHWIYWLGPVLGSLLAVGAYKLLTALHYYTANPGQDDDGITKVQVVRPPQIPELFYPSRQRDVNDSRNSFSSQTRFAHANRN